MAMRQIRSAADNIEAVDETELEAAQRVRRRGRLQILLVVVCAFGVLYGTKVSQAHKLAAVGAITAQSLAGTWELQSIADDSVSKAGSALISQRVTFASGSVIGETRLRADSAAATTAMPFPDESVGTITASPDAHDITVNWHGTYTIKENGRIELRIGKAYYIAAAKWDPQTQTLTLDHDTILTYSGVARYINVAVSKPPLP